MALHIEKFIRFEESRPINIRQEIFILLLLIIAGFAIYLNTLKGADTYKNLGFIYYRNGNRYKALEYFEKAIRLDPEMANIIFQSK